ncbi:hypothetical protein QZH41_017655 [Actinostola sp. cb2023]|nr:hypothetical protein QZH41_017655 [Actinostola sp. cb2023]
MIKKIAPLSSSQKNKSINSVMGTKTLKVRYYGGSASNDFRIAAGVAQANKGFGYVSDVLADMDITSGEACKRYIRRATVKQKLDKERKNKQRLQALEKKAAVGSSDDITKVLEEVTREDVRNAERAASQSLICTTSDIHTTPLEQPPRDSVVLFFDLETTSRKKDCEILQLAVVAMEKSFSHYIVPSGNIARVPQRFMAFLLPMTTTGTGEAVGKASRVPYQKGKFKVHNLPEGIAFKRPYGYVVNNDL